MEALEKITEIRGHKKKGFVFSRDYNQEKPYSKRTITHFIKKILES